MVCEEVVVVENEGGCSIHGRERCWVVKFIPVRPGNVVFDFLIWLFGIGICLSAHSPALLFCHSQLF